MEIHNLRIGLGTDLHRLQEKYPLWIGGIQIESPWGCVAHSDGDALLHALIDALLGATHLGDIGEHFPPSDAQWKNADSKQLLAEVLRLIRAKHPRFLIVNVDAVIELQVPKLSPFKKEIQASLANALGIDAERVSIKAKTGEHLPPIGTHEAIATQVVVLCCL
jgi:2-C-methyl-D-erythritol 2,4-cyclodiphosphate synthase